MEKNIIINTASATPEALAALFTTLALNGLDFSFVNGLKSVNEAPKAPKEPEASKKPAGKTPSSSTKDGRHWKPGKTPASKKPAPVTASLVRNVTKGHGSEVWFDRHIPFALFDEVKQRFSSFGAVYDGDVVTNRPKKDGSGMSTGGFRFETAAKAKAFVEAHPTMTFGA